MESRRIFVCRYVRKLVCEVRPAVAHLNFFFLSAQHWEASQNEEVPRRLFVQPSPSTIWAFSPKCVSLLQKLIPKTFFFYSLSSRVGDCGINSRPIRITRRKKKLQPPEITITITFGSHFCGLVKTGPKSQRLRKTSSFSTSGSKTLILVWKHMCVIS